MRSKIYKPILFVLVACLAINTTGFAQKKHKAAKHRQRVEKSGSSTADDTSFDMQMDDLGINVDMNLKGLGKTINMALDEIKPQIVSAINNVSVSISNSSPKIKLKLKNILNNVDINVSDVDPQVSVNVNGSSISSDDDDDNNGDLEEKTKNYSKSYPVDANDKLRLNNQYGRITVLTWDRPEVKVDVLIKATANQEDEAQKLLDGVEIQDNKSGDVVSFRTEIQRNKNSWSIWNWGGRSKTHKVEINYTVHMPSKNSLDVEQSYGSVSLPDMDGRVKISASYANVVAQNLSNPTNDIEGSYGNLKVGNMNGGRLDFSYGNVDMAECTNLKADLSYGSFKLGKLKGSADLDLSYVGGFKINDVAPSLKRLNINSSYSGVSLGISNDNSFDFDITVSNAGFNYDDDKVTLTSKTPADNRHYSPTKNYKGHFGKGNSDSKVTINSSYGGVHFD